MRHWRQLLSAASGAAWLWLNGPVQAQTQGILREVYTGISGGTIADLTNNPAFPDNPTSVNLVTDFFEAPINIDDNYGQRMRALIAAPTNGNYTFWISSDDYSTLYLSTDETPANRRVIASVVGWTNPREWTKYASQKSTPIFLSSGQRYYLEALMKEGGGGDNLAVRWQLPNGTVEEPIPASRLTPYGLTAPIISVQPTNLTTIEGSSVSFTVKVSNGYGVTYQWLRDGASVPNATNAFYTLEAVSLADSSSAFSCSLVNTQGSTNSSTATLTVVRDTTPPTLVSVVNLGSSTAITAGFSEPVEAASAAQSSNYVISGGVTVTAARLAGDVRSVVLTTSPLAFGTNYTLTVNNVRDRASQPNTIAANSTRGFTLDFTPVDISFVKGVLEPLGPSSRKTGLVISEIMYKPAPRADGLNLEWVEIYNSNPFVEDIGGYRLSGDIDFAFPTGTRIPGASFLVVAKAPADLQSVYGLSNVLGPYSNSLKSSGRVQLRNDLGSVYLEVPYSNQPPWPVAADGTGHSLVLARPSYGEGDPRAWNASDLPGGSPGRAEAPSPEPLRTVVLNELLAHTDDPERDFIELYNYSSQPVDLSGAFLSDRPDTNKFRISNGITIPAKGFVSFNQDQLGFALNAAGESVFLVNSNQTRVIDAVSFEGQANGVSMGRYPDGAPDFYPLLAPTPGQPNQRCQVSEVVINELMYKPISGDSDDQYVELYNQGTGAVRLDGWRFTSGIKFTFPRNTSIFPNSYLVVARNLTNLLAHYSNLTVANTIGNFSGKLSGQGDRLALSMPQALVSTNAAGVRLTNTALVVMDEVTYGAGGRWGHWADGGGSSLELIDPHSNHRLASNWADSDETAKAPWTTIQATGTLDNGADPANALEVGLMGEGECLLDNAEVRVGATGSNLVANPGFESGLGSWFPQGDHVRSTLEPTEGYNSSQSLHVRATARGDTGANRIRALLTASLNSGQIGTLRAQARWLHGWPEILLRLHGNWLEATGRLTVPANLGTPGALNSRAVANAGPAIYQVRHSPVLPAAGQSVTVIARVDDPDGLAALAVNYRIDPSTNLVAVPMVYSGAGFYSATIPGQPGGTLVAFHVQAADNASRPVTVTFPNDAPARECLVRFGETLPGKAFGAYRLWLTQTNLNAWVNRPVLSNELIDGTFVYGNWRVIYNMGSRYAGSPYHQGFNSPVGNLCHYSFDMPKDDQLLGTTDFNKLHDPGNGPGDDDTLQREQIAYWMARQLGLPWNYKRYVYFFVNGLQRDRLMEDTQVPGADVVNEVFPNDTNGHLYKLQPWFEFFYAPVGGMGFNNESWCTLLNFSTTGGARKLARYRWNWLVRAVNTSANDYTNVFALTDAANTAANGPYTANLAAQADMEQWMRTFAVNHAVGNWDSFGNRNAQNMYAYKPTRAPWWLLIWDFNIVLGNSGADGPTGDNLFQYNTADNAMLRIYNNPPFRRAYWRAFKAILDGPMATNNVFPVLDAKYAAFVANGISASSPAGVKTWISSRRTYLLQQLNSVASTFAITSNSGNDFSTPANYLALTGTAPVEVKTITVNGIAYPVTWTTVTGWRLSVPLLAGTNHLAIAGYDWKGNALTNDVATINVNYTGPAELAQDHVVINEILHTPTAEGAEFIELFNTSPVNAFDLSRCRLEGVAFDFPDGSVIQPQSFLVVAKDAAVFAATYGTNIPVAGEFPGKLAKDGETLRLILPGPTADQDVVINEVTYAGALPWPPAAVTAGASLQLIDPTQDDDRVGNWASVINVATPGKPNSVGATLMPFPPLAINEVQPTNIATVADQAGDHDPWIELYNAGTNALDLSAFSLADNYTNLAQWAFPSNTVIQAGQFLVVWADGEPGQATATELHTNFRIDPVTGSIALSRLQNNQPAVVDYLDYTLMSPGRSYGSFPDGDRHNRQRFFYPTPGATNNPAAGPVQVFINEWMARNSTTLADPGDGNFDDWFELYNAGASAVDLSGYTLTGNLTNTVRWPIPAGTVIPAKGFLLVWADKETAQNSPGRDLHVDFKLNHLGDSIGLFGPDGTVTDAITFGEQTNDVSQGRWPDGHAAPFYFMPTPTPRIANVISPDELPGLQLLQVTLSPFGVIGMTWNAEPGKVYAVQAKDRLDDPGWAELSQITATDTTASFTEAAGHTGRFYRIQRITP